MGYDPRMTPSCPTCKADLHTVRPVRIKADPDTRLWQGRKPEALGFMCKSCSTLLPLSVTQERDDPAAG